MYPELLNPLISTSTYGPAHCSRFHSSFIPRFQTEPETEARQCPRKSRISQPRRSIPSHIRISRAWEAALTWWNKPDLPRGVPAAFVSRGAAQLWDIGSSRAALRRGAGSQQAGGVPGYCCSANNPHVNPRVTNGFYQPHA